MAHILFLVNDLTVVGGSTKVTYQLASQWATKRKVQIVGLFQSQSQLPFPLHPSVECRSLYSKPCRIHEIKTYFHFLKTRQWKPCLQLVTTLFYLVSNRRQVKKDLFTLTQDVDLIIIPDVYGLSFLDPSILKQKKIVVHLHNTASFLTQNQLLMKTLTQHQVHIDQLVMLTQHDAQTFESLGFQNVSFIYNEVELPTHLSFPRPKPDADKIVFLGRLDTRKGVELLVPLMKELLRKRPSAQLHIYGDGPECYQLAQDIKAAQLEQSVLLHGHTTSLDEVFKDASCFWLTSKWEGLPLTLLEAFAHGVPAVAFRCFDGIDEILTDQQVGYIVPPLALSEMVEKTEQLLSQSSQWKKMSQAAHQRAHEFTPTVIHQEWEMLFEFLLSSELSREGYHHA